MAELSMVFGTNNGDDSYDASAGPPTPTNNVQSGYNNNDVVSNNNSQVLLDNGNNGNNGNNGHNGIDNTIEKLQTQINKQKKVNILQKEILKQSNGDDTTTIGGYVKTKKDMYKIIMIVLVVVVALLLNDTIKYYLNKYILSTDLTTKNELCIRASVILIIFLVIWTLKALNVKY
jgi:hypothetical protein